VLSYVFGELTRQRGGPPPIDILSGTSVGAINACFLAAHMAEPTRGMQRLFELWTKMDLSHVLGFGFRQAISLPRVLRGGGLGAGLFDVRPMARLVAREINWRSITRALRRGHLRTLSVSTTEISSGRTVIFMQTSPDGALPSTAPPRTIIRAERIGPLHALASAAIPILFPPVEIGGSIYVDGSLRQTTPIAPALRLGATHVLAIGLSRELRAADDMATPAAGAPGASFLLGKVLNAFLLDHIQLDLEQLERTNALLADGTRVYGEEFVRKVSFAALANGRQPYRPVRCLAIRPTEDIGRLAAEHIRSGKLRGGPLMTRRLLSLLDTGVGSEADLGSYLLFDGTFAKRLIDLGWADACARRDELLSFFGHASDEQKPPGAGDIDEHSGDTWMPPSAVG
jgi:NTE family protein